jgi:hypothetical protein
MSYAGKYLKSKGQTCTINRTPPTTSKVSIKRSTRSSRDLGSREAYWEGLILADTALQSGEVVEIFDKNGQSTGKYLVQSVNPDPASGEHAFFAAKCNAILQHKRETETTDENNNPVKIWATINADVDAYGEIVTYALRQYDPGLLEQTRYIFQVPKSIGALQLDRVVYNSNYQIVSIDDVALRGIDRIQLAVDLRIVKFWRRMLCIRNISVKATTKRYAKCSQLTILFYPTKSSMLI